MTKIKLSLPSGSEVEKPVISYFSNGSNYLILDGEGVGSMGLPIILVSKVNGDKVEKIVDQNEWQQVKGFLKGIISGGPSTYLATPDSLVADETYYTQLTLPVASYDALKNAYVVPNAGVEAANVPETSPALEQGSAVPEAPAIENPTPAIDPVNPVANEPEVTDNAAMPNGEAVDVPASVVPEQPISEAVPTADVPVDTPSVPEVVPETPGDGMQPVNMSTEVAPEAPAIETPVPIVEDQAITNPIIGEEPQVNEGLNATDGSPIPDAVDAPTPDVSSPEIPPVEPTNNEPVVPDVAPIEAPVEEVQTPIIDENPVDKSGNNIEVIKQNFMKACEELFDSIASLK